MHFRISVVAVTVLRDTFLIEGKLFVGWRKLSLCFEGLLKTLNSIVFYAGKSCY